MYVFVNMENELKQKEIRYQVQSMPTTCLHSSISLADNWGCAARAARPAVVVMVFCAKIPNSFTVQ